MLHISIDGEWEMLVMEAQSVINFVSPKREIKKLIVNFVVRYYLDEKWGRWRVGVGLLDLLLFEGLRMKKTLSFNMKLDIFLS